jgi:glycosyltransferase involved in cell wall biosynthesis
MSRVSVTIATYKRSGMVRQAVEAALAQTRPIDEIVVSDDASPDDTLLVLRRMAQTNPELKIVEQPINTGGVPNWNAALSAATGDYLCWCSDDDRFVEDHIEASVGFLEAHPKAGLVHSGFIDVVETGGLIETEPRRFRFPQPVWVDRESLIPYMIRYYDWPFHPSTIVMRREVWEQVGEFDKTYALADTDWFVRAVEQFPAVLLPRHGVLNRRHPDNWSNRVGSARMQHEIFSIVAGAIERRFRGNPVAAWFWRSLWRWNVRARLCLTLYARVRSGHAEAACAAWNQMALRTGLRLPDPIVRLGEALLRRLCAGRKPIFEDTRQSVSPL